MYKHSPHTATHTAKCMMCILGMILRPSFYESDEDDALDFKERLRKIGIPQKSSTLQKKSPRKQYRIKTANIPSKRSLDSMKRDLHSIKSAQYSAKRAQDSVKIDTVAISLVSLHHAGTYSP